MLTMFVNLTLLSNTDFNKNYQKETPMHYTEPVSMMASEALVETMVRQKVDTVYGIVGSAFMDALDLFPEAGIRFLAGEIR